MTFILGIDPGLRHTGWGVIQKQGNSLRFLGCGTIHSDDKAPLSDRLYTLYEGILNVFNTYTIDDVAIEETFVNTNAKSSLKLGHARGALMLAASLSSKPIHEYAATLVKKSIVGVGRAQKDQVEMMVKYILPSAVVDSADAADALAIAICHSHHMLGGIMESQNNIPSYKKP